jgi:molybdate transport system substrate-binding protein
MTALRPLIVALGLILTGMTMATANELNVIIGGSLSALFKDLGPQFETASGHKLLVHFDSTPNIVARINAGTPFDAVLVPSDVFKDATAKSHFVPASIGDVARVGFGVIVRAGALKPDISTSEALKAALLKASSVASTPSSAGGAYIAKVYERLGIADAMKAKTVALPMPSDIAPMVAKGDAEFGIFLMNVFNGPGIELAGPFPAELQQDLVFASGIATNARELDAARTFIDYLKTPAATAAFRAAGMRPG